MISAVGFSWMGQYPPPASTVLAQLRCPALHITTAVTMIPAAHPPCRFFVKKAAVNVTVTLILRVIRRGVWVVNPPYT